MKYAVKSFMECELGNDIGLKLIIPLANIALKNERQMNQILDRSDYELYRAFKRQRSGEDV